MWHGRHKFSTMGPTKKLCSKASWVVHGKLLLLWGSTKFYSIILCFIIYCYIVSFRVFLCNWPLLWRTTQCAKQMVQS
jgi:hypothetical protein